MENKVRAAPVVGATARCLDSVTERVLTMLGDERSNAKDQPGGPAGKPPAGPDADCHYARKVKRELAFLNKARDALGDLQDAVDKMDPDFDPTAYFTDPDESRLVVVDELLSNAAALLRGGQSEEAEDLLKGRPGVYQALHEAFTTILDAGLEFCEDD
jgi:hypothetical protein